MAEKMNEGRETILVIDFGGQYNQLIARRVRECGVYAEVHPYTFPVEEIRKIGPKGLIFTGGPNSVYGESALEYDPELLKLGIPVDGATWNKEEGPNNKKYRKYGVTLYQTVQMGLSFCCALDLVRDGEPYRLLFPAYELATMQRLTGLFAPELPKTDTGKTRAELERAGDFSWSSGPVRPRFYWHIPKGEAKDYFSITSDEEFKAQHPALYGILVAIGIAVLLVPCFAFAIAAGRVTGDPNNGWILLGVLGGFIAGAGLFNLVAAWMHQYLGHIFTLLCLLIGCGLMAFTWFVLL